MPSVLPSEAEYAQLAPRPGSPVWRAFNDVRMLTTAGYATLLQVAHPTVGAGVHEYSSFTKDPWGRLLRTLDYVHGTIYGGPELAGSIGRRVREMHKTIRGAREDGQPYNAMEPDAFAWVHATLAAAIVEGRRVFAKPMTPTEKEQFWQQWIAVGRLVGVRPRDLPVDWPSFVEYFDRMVADELVWTPAVPEVMATVSASAPPNVPRMRPAVWKVASAPMSLQLRVTTVGLVPRELRQRLRLDYSKTDARIFRAMAAASRASAPLVRGPLREFGPNYVRWRREALARGDVAAAGSAPDRRAVPA